MGFGRTDEICTIAQTERLGCFVWLEDSSDDGKKPKENKTPLNPVMPCLAR